MLGGDANEGERLIRRAAELDPSSPVPRLHLAHVLIDQGQEAEARELAHDAIPRAEKSPEPAIRAEAKQLEARLE
jgi:Tfp pilus assembly protein PilF